MNVTSISDFRKDIKRYVDEVDQDQEPLIVTRSDGVTVAVLPLRVYNSYTETDYLMSNPANAEHLRRSMAEARAGKVQKHELLEVED